MTVVHELAPGDIVQVHPNGSCACFIARVPQHPLYPDLNLVIWRLEDGTTSLDALSAMQDCGEVVGDGERHLNLRAALRHPFEVRGRER